MAQSNVDRQRFVAKKGYVDFSYRWLFVP